MRKRWLSKIFRWVVADDGGREDQRGGYCEGMDGVRRHVPTQASEVVRVQTVSERGRVDDRAGWSGESSVQRKERERETYGVTFRRHLIFRHFILFSLIHAIFTTSLIRK